MTSNFSTKPNLIKLDKCKTCGKPIKEDEKYTEIEKTEWNGDEGKSITYFWHDECGGEI